MSRSRFLMAGVAALFYAFSLAAVAQPAPKAAQPKLQVAPQRLCVDADLTGTYSLMDVQETPPGQETEWLKDYPFHYLVFGPGHAYHYIAAHHKIVTPEDMDKSIKLSNPEDAFKWKYTLDQAGVLTLYVNDRVDYTFRCVMVNTKSGKSLPGDLMLEGYSHRNIPLTKLFRHKP